MLTEEEKKELFNKIAEKKHEISVVRNDLNNINDRKEEFFAKKTELSKKISSLITEIKKDRQERNVLTQEVRTSKEERNSQNQEVKDAVSKIKELESKKEELISKNKIKENPQFLLRKIAQLEFRIETQPMSFEQEKKLMKMIKDMKKNVQESKAVMDVIRQIQTLSNQADEKKRSAQEMHHKVQLSAKRSQERHETLIVTSTEIDKLKAEEEEAFKNFIEYKKRFNEQNDKIKALLSELKEIADKAESNKLQLRDASEKRKRDIIEQKKMSVEEKLKKGMKLTTEDLLAFQGMNPDEEDP